MGKLMLTQPFEPHWANLAMPITSRGVSTGMIPYQKGAFTIDLDCIDHKLIFTASWGARAEVAMGSMSVAEMTAKMFQALKDIGVDLKIKQAPQEVSHPIDFNRDTEPSAYKAAVVNAWWRILVSTTRVLMVYHSRFFGITPRIGLFWGTLDLRDARYKGTPLPITKETSSYIGRNAMDDAQFEVGWSASNEKYLTPSFFALAFPKPDGLEQARVEPAGTKWVPAIGEWVLDYDELRRSKDPDADLLRFFESTYQAVAELGKWNPKLIGSGKPV